MFGWIFFPKLLPYHSFCVCILFLVSQVIFQLSVYAILWSHYLLNVAVGCCVKQINIRLRTQLQGNYSSLKWIIYLREKWCIISFWVLLVLVLGDFLVTGIISLKRHELNLRAGIVYFDLIKTKLLLLSPQKILSIWA